MMWRLSNPAMPYAWGSVTSIPEFLGHSENGTPVAEIWIGAHPKAPSVVLGLEGADIPLNQAIEERPAIVGDEAADRFGARLPFLVKLLAAGRPLSLQVHPDEAMAADGFALEQALGVSMDAAERTYKDPFHKPEVMIALERTETLAGFRAAEEIAQLLSSIGGPWAIGVAARLEADDLRPAFRALLDESSWRANSAEVLARCAALASADRAYELVGLLQEFFPGDSGIGAPLMLNVVLYGPGEALFVPTGQIHAHIKGFGIEVMAASDNVIRAGLTSKHVDRTALFAALNRHSENPQLLRFPEGLIDVGADEFRINIHERGTRLNDVGPKIALALEDHTTVGTDVLRRGDSMIIAHGEGPAVSQGRACVVYVPSRYD